MIWHKSSFSGHYECVELAECSHGYGGIHIRNSRRPNGEVVTVTCGELAAFIKAAKAGEFDDLAGLA